MGKIYGKLVDAIFEWQCDEHLGLTAENKVRLLNKLEPIIKKFEKRGAKKERKRILDGTEGYERQLAEGLIEYVDRLNAEYKAPQPKVDAEKVRGLIHNIREHAYNKGRAYGAGDMPGYHRERDILWDAYRALLAALGIE